MKTSIIIPVYNNLEYTKKCLLALRKNTNLDQIEIIIVNNASTDSTKGYLDSLDFINVTHNNINRNFAGANNQGAKAAKGEILIFLNNDTEVHENWLEPLIRDIGEDSKIGAIGTKLLFPDGTIQHAGVVISPDKTPRHIYYQANPDELWVNKKREFQVVTAACIAIPKKVFNEVGGFDEKFVNGLEDVDLCLKIKKAGYKVIYEPKSVITHHESVSPGRFKHNKGNADLYMSRWKNTKSDEHGYYKEDGKSWLWILGQDLRSMSYGPNEYGTRPLYVSILRWYYIPYHKIKTILTYLFKGDFKGLSQKIKSKVFK